MINIKTDSGVSIIIYADIKEMPISRYNEMQKYMMMDAGIGSDMDSVQARFTKLHAFLAENKIEEAKKEAENLHYTHFSILEKINYKSLSFACLVHSIDGNICNDITEEGIRSTAEIIEISDLTQKELEEHLIGIKKKSL